MGIKSTLHLLLINRSKIVMKRGKSMEPHIIHKNEEQVMIRKFIEKVQVESSYKKFLKLDIIEQMINIFKGNYQKSAYPNQISNCLELALQFYKNYNYKFYKMIVYGIENKKIIISRDVFKPYTDTDNGMTYIRMYGNDGDLFLLVHEFAHYIDRNSEPKIISSNLDCLSEVFSFFIEKQLELWLPKDKYDDLIFARRNNRIYFESNILKAVEYELYYEKLFYKNGKIEEDEIDIEKIRCIMKYANRDLINYLMRYPLANVLSDYLVNIKFNIDKEDLCEKCLQTDLYSVLHGWSNNIGQLSKGKNK